MGDGAAREGIARRAKQRKVLAETILYSREVLSVAL